MPDGASGQMKQCRSLQERHFHSGLLSGALSVSGFHLVEELTSWFVDLTVSTGTPAKFFIIG